MVFVGRGFCLIINAETDGYDGKFDVRYCVPGIFRCALLMVLIQHWRQSNALLGEGGFVGAVLGLPHHTTPNMP